MFLLWMVAGLLLSLGLVGIASIGIFVLPVAVVLTLLLIRYDRGARRAAGTLVGAALPIFYVAFLNRGGPGIACVTAAATGDQSCVDRLNPLPWALVGLALVALGVALYVRLRDRRAPIPA
jgi:hypothetical protein